MMIQTVINIRNRIERSVRAEEENYPVKFVEFSYDIKDDLITGVANGHYLLHYMDQAEGVPVLLRGFMMFEGEINGQEGKFLAQEDGAIHQGTVTVRGRVVDATDGLCMLVGTYNLYQQETERHFNMTFDIEL